MSVNRTNASTPASTGSNSALDTRFRSALARLSQADRILTCSRTADPHLEIASAMKALDGDKAALAALDDARRHAQGLKPIETRLRDLMREPLSPKELEPFGAVLIDPPRAGAKAQAERLARSKVPTVIAVSCNPATLGRDLRLLVDGGYRIESTTPFDQFLWSAHVEVVAVLRR